MGRTGRISRFICRSFQYVKHPFFLPGGFRLVHFPGRALDLWQPPRGPAARNVKHTAGFTITTSTAVVHLPRAAGVHLWFALHKREAHPSNEGKHLNFPLCPFVNTLSSLLVQIFSFICDPTPLRLPLFPWVCIFSNVATRYCPGLLERARCRPPSRLYTWVSPFELDFTGRSLFQVAIVVWFTTRADDSHATPVGTLSPL